MLILSKLIVDAHDNFMSIDINMSLHEWHRLGQHIVASTNKVNVEHVVVSHNAEHSLVVIFCCLWVEFYYYSSLRVRFYVAFGFRK